MEFEKINGGFKKMKNLFKVILTTALLLLMFSVCASADGERAYTTADVLNVRSQPSIVSDVIGQYTYGTNVDITDRVDVWYQIRYNSGYAYIHSDYVAFSYAQTPDQSILGQNLVETAKQYIGTPYVYGGMSPSGFDCSGFVKYIYSLYGVSLDRVAHDQASNGVWVARENLQPGDIICFANRPGGSYIGHVGIYVGDNQFIHSPRTGYTVTIESLDSNYGARYSAARRIF